MVTVVNNPSGTDRVIERSDTGGWAVAVVILIAVVAVGGFFAWRYYRAPAQQSSGANINVTIPAGSTDDTTTSGDGSAQAAQ